MQVTEAHNERMAKLTFASVYPHYVTKIQKKGRTVAELHQVITWLTGYDDAAIQQQIDQGHTFQAFFASATVPTAASHITGRICGYKIQDIQNELTRRVRYLDKLVDDLAKGKPMEKILRVG